MKNYAIGKSITIVTIAFLLLSCKTASNKNQTYISNTQNIQHLQQSVVSIIQKNALSGELEGPVCAAFFISPNLLTTAYHCLNLVQTYPLDMENNVSIDFKIILYDQAVGSEIMFINRQQFERFAVYSEKMPTLYEATVVAASSENDLALLKVSEKYVSTSWIRISPYEPLVGENVYGMGMPSGQPWVLTQGIVSTIKPAGRGDILHQAHISPGASGSPLVNDIGHLVGVNVGYIYDAHYLGVAIPTKHLQTLIGAYMK